MNKLEVQKLVSYVNNLIVNEERFSLNIYAMFNANISNDFIKDFGEYSKFKIDAIAYNEQGELKISCYQVDSLDNTMELIMTYNYEFIWATLHIYESFGDYVEQEKNKNVDKDFNEFLLKNNAINQE